MAMHSNERPFACAHCSFRGLIKGNLDQHMRAMHREHLPQAAAAAPAPAAPAVAAPVSASATPANAPPAAAAEP